MVLRKAILSGLLLLLLTPKLFAGEVVVAAASDLSAAAKEFIGDFERRTGHTVKLSLGSSGNFHAQIKNGAPFDVFLSADLNYVRELEKAGLTEAGSSFVYAIGRVVLWVPQNSPLDVRTLGMKALLQPGSPDCDRKSRTCAVWSCGCRCHGESRRLQRSQE